MSKVIGFVFFENVYGFYCGFFDSFFEEVFFCDYLFYRDYGLCVIIIEVFGKCYILLLVFRNFKVWKKFLKKMY